MSLFTIDHSNAKEKEMVGCGLGQVTWQQEAPASVPDQVQGSRPAERWNSAPPNRLRLAHDSLDT